MEPIKFPEANITFAENQPEYKPLPAFKANTPYGEVVTCWNLTFRERLRILFFGKLWLCLMTFNKPLTPVFIATKKSEILVKNDTQPKPINPQMNK